MAELDFYIHVKSNADGTAVELTTIPPADAVAPTAEGDNLKGDKSMIVIRTNLEKMPTTCCDCPLKVYDPQIVWKDALMTQ